MSQWGTATPDLTMVRNAARAVEREGFDVHTITIILNGQHGGFDVTIEATNEDLEDHRAEYRLDHHGGLEQTRKMEAI